MFLNYKRFTFDVSAGWFLPLLDVRFVKKTARETVCLRVMILRVEFTFHYEYGKGSEDE